MAGGKYSLCGVEGGGEWLEEQGGWNRHDLGHLHRAISRRTGHCDGCLAECSGECGALEKPWVLWPPPPGPEQAPPQCCLILLLQPGGLVKGCQWKANQKILRF